MGKHALLNNIEHHDLKIITRYGAQFGDDIGTMLTFPTEYADVQKEYPIFFRKDLQTGEFQSIILLGFEKNENLYLQQNSWNAHYIPAVVARGPFLIGFQEKEIDDVLRKEPVIHVDLDNPRVSRTEGEPIFLPQGGNSPYIEHIAMILNGIKDGLEISKAMFAAFTSMNLIEPATVNVKVNNETGYELQGLYTISQERLASLDGDSLLKLNKAGFLQGAFLVLTSMSNVHRLITIKQRRMEAETKS